MMFIEISNLKFKYKNAKDTTLKDFSLKINPGEIVAILGESGSGKSTVLRLLSGLEVPNHGRMKIDQKIMVDDQTFILPEHRGLGMVFQDYALFPHMTVEENVKFGLKKMGKSEKKKRISEVLDLVGLGEYKKRYPYELSGGQQQRVALARALAPKPPLLLLDEPFSNLDAHLQNQIREDLEKIIRRAGTTSIFVTHDEEDAKAIADRVIVLKDGEIIKEGKPRIVLG